MGGDMERERVRWITIGIAIVIECALVFLILLLLQHLFHWHIINF